MNFSCFHGAGHAFLAETRDVNRSLKLCSSISDDISYEGDIEGCFEGVFSEVANLVGGYDGETGRKLTGVPPMEINVSPVKYCAQFDERYQAMCAFEINGIGFGINTSTEDVGLIMKSCITDAANAIISEACLFNVAASYVRHEIKRDGIVTFQPWILNESKHNRVVYLVAAGQEIAQHNLAGQTIDTDKFCDSFVEKDEIDLCKRQVISYELVAPVIEK